MVWHENRWSALALGVSAAVHVVLGVWVSLRPLETFPRHEVSAEFVFVEPPPPKTPEPTPEPEKPPEPAPVKPPPKVRPRPVAQPASEPVKTPETPEEPLVQDVPRNVEPAPVEDVPRAKVTLVPGTTSSFAISLDAGIAPSDGVEVVGGGLRALEAPKDLVGTLTKETLGRGRVDRGLVHPYYSQLGKALLKNWDADRVAKSGLKGLMEQTQQNFKQYNEIWAERAQAYGAGGNPMGDVTPSSNRRAATNERIQGLTGVDLDQRKELAKAMREQFRATRRAIIRVVQATDGRLLKVELVQPSQDANVDKEALADVRAAAQKLPPPPPEALERGKDTLSSLWSFELVVSISPPVPTFTFEFDEALGFIDARLPLDRRIYKKVRLVSVE
ncbi:MAG: TonB C-terminal domain-containing protein [Myxococcota bacterium]